MKKNVCIVKMEEYNKEWDSILKKFKYDLIIDIFKKIRNAMTSKNGEVYEIKKIELNRLRGVELNKK